MLKKSGLKLCLQPGCQLSTYFDGRDGHSDHGVVELLLKQADNAGEVSVLDLRLRKSLVEGLKLPLFLLPLLELGILIQPSLVVLGQNVYFFKQVETSILLTLVLLFLLLYYCIKFTIFGFKLLSASHASDSLGLRSRTRLDLSKLSLKLVLKFEFSIAFIHLQSAVISNS